MAGIDRMTIAEVVREVLRDEHADVSVRPRKRSEQALASVVQHLERGQCVWRLVKEC